MKPLPTELTVKGGIDVKKTKELGEFYASLFGNEIKPEPIPFMAPILLFSDTAIQQYMAQFAVANGQILVHEYQSVQITRPLESGVGSCVTINLEHSSSTDDLANVNIAISTPDGKQLANLQTVLRKIPGKNLHLIKGSSLPASARSGDIFWISTKPITFENIIHYARLSGDNNPIHTDKGYANSIGLGGTVVPGMLLAGLTQSALSISHPDKALKQLRIRFTAPVLTGQSVRLGIQEKTKRHELHRKNMRIFFVAENETIAAVADVSVQ